MQITLATKPRESGFHLIKGKVPIPVCLEVLGFQCLEAFPDFGDNKVFVPQ